MSVSDTLKITPLELQKKAADVLAVTLNLTLNHAFSDAKCRASSFEIINPTSTSVKTVKGQYLTAALYGGQKFGITSAYVGKKGDVILVFTPKLPLTEYRFMEMKLNDAIGNFESSFSAFIRDLSKSGFNISNVEIKTTVEVIAAANQQRMTDPRYGAW